MHGDSVQSLYSGRMVRWRSCPGEHRFENAMLPPTSPLGVTRFKPVASVRRLWLSVLTVRRGVLGIWSTCTVSEKKRPMVSVSESVSLCGAFVPLFLSLYLSSLPYRLFHVYSCVARKLVGVERNPSASFMLSFGVCSLQLGPKSLTAVSLCSSCSLSALRCVLRSRSRSFLSLLCVILFLLFTLICYSLFSVVSTHLPSLLRFLSLPPSLSVSFILSSLVFCFPSRPSRPAAARFE